MSINHYEELILKRRRRPRYGNCRTCYHAIRLKSNSRSRWSWNDREENQ